MRAKGSLSTTSSGRPTAANSRTNGLPTSRPTSVTRKMPRLLSGCIHRSMNAWLTTNVRIVSTENVATAPTSKMNPGAFLVRPSTRPATATANATTTAVSNGTLPTSTQYTIHGAKPMRTPTAVECRAVPLGGIRRRERNEPAPTRRVRQPHRGRTRSGVQPHGRRGQLSACTAPGARCWSPGSSVGPRSRWACWPTCPCSPRPTTSCWRAWRSRSGSWRFCWAAASCSPKGSWCR